MLVVCSGSDVVQRRPVGTRHRSHVGHLGPVQVSLQTAAVTSRGLVVGSVELLPVLWRVSVGDSPSLYWLRGQI